MIKPTISLCMIVKNEENFLRQCLESVKGLVDEIIVVDTGSTDKTKEIARGFGAKVYDFEWCDDFSKARNESLRHAAGNWILVLDADETISERDKEKIKQLAGQARDNEVGFVLRQRNYFNPEGTEKNPLGWTANKEDKYEEGKAARGWFETPAVRLFRNIEEIKFKGAVHECVSEFLKDKGKIVFTEIPIHHFGKLNKETWEKKKKMYERLGKKKLEEEKNYYNYYELARQCIGNNKIEKAVKLLEKSIALNSRFWKSWFDLGTIFLMKKDLEKAQDYLGRANELEKNNPSILGNLGIVLAQKGELEKAKEKLESAIKLNPNHAGNCLNLARVYKRLGKEKMFRLAFNRAAWLNPEYKKLIRKK